MTRPSSHRVRLCFVGSMLGRNPGYVTTQGEKLADLFERSGYPVVCVSHRINRAARLADVFATLVRERNRIDVLVVLVYGGTSFVLEDIATWIGRRADIPLILSLHGGDLPRFKERYSRWVHRVFRRADAIVAQSAYLARFAAALGRDARVIPNVIELEGYPHRLRTSARPRLFWMRAFHPIYEPEMALETLARVRARHPEATLVMAGPDKGGLALVRQRASQMGLAGAVEFPGFLDLAGKHRYAEACDVFLNTSAVDNRPVSVIEACALGLPVVSTDVGGIRDFLTHEETALLVPRGDAAAMAGAVLRLLDDPALVEHLSRNGRALAALSAPERVRAAWEDLFQQVLQGARDVRDLRHRSAR